MQCLGPVIPRNMNIWLITFKLHMFIQCIRRSQFDERVFYNEYIG